MRPTSTASLEGLEGLNKAQTLRPSGSCYDMTGVLARSAPQLLFLVLAMNRAYENRSRLFGNPPYGRLFLYCDKRIPVVTYNSPDPQK
jgi:hypothetical protein